MSIFRPIVSFLRKAVIEVSKADGKDGLSIADVEAIVAHVDQVNVSLPRARGLVKLGMVTDFVKATYGERVAEILTVVIAVFCYFIHKRTK